MAFVERIARSQRQPDSVQAQCAARPVALEPRVRLAAVAEEVLAVDLDEIEVRVVLEERGIVGRAQPNPDGVRIERMRG